MESPGDTGLDESEGKSEDGGAVILVRGHWSSIGGILEHRVIFLIRDETNLGC